MTRLKRHLVNGLIVAHMALAFGAEQADDTVSKALDDELKRSLSLHLEDLDKPYFVQYEVDDVITHRIGAVDGALLTSAQSHARVLESQIRVGSYQLDNSNFAARAGGGRSGLGGTTQLPIDDDYLALRHAIWLATDWQYKQAVEALAQKRAYLKDRNAEERAPDFTKTEAVHSRQERASLAFPRAVWEGYVRSISARFHEYAHIQNADVSLVAGAENRYLVNSEGSRVRDGHTEALLRITAEAQADDNQPLADHLSYYAPTPEQLPPLPTVLADVSKLADRLAAAVRAPVLDDYTGPVLFDGQAAPQLFRQLLARGITAQPDPAGGQRRSAQTGDDLENRIGKRILPQTFQIYDDPRLPKYEDIFLAGHYLFDDESVPAQRVDIVVDGKLEGMVTSRTPTKLFAHPNGHGRRGGGDTSRSAVGCLYIESTKSLNADELKKQLLEAADAEGLKFALRITGIQSRAGGLDGGARFRRGGGRGMGRLVGDPTLIYKVYVADGHEEPVRGCEFTSIELQSLRRILAAGSVRTVQNNIIGVTPSSSIIAPAVLIGEIELSRIKSEPEKPPILPSPQARKSPITVREP